MKKVKEEVSFTVKTLDNSAVAGINYRPLKTTVKMSKTQINLKVWLRENQSEGDSEFYLQLMQDGEALEGADTQMRVTIKDENKVGVVGFYNARIAVRRKDRYATLKLVR